jgi:hypothetical protein
LAYRTLFLYDYIFFTVTEIILHIIAWRKSIDSLEFF